MRVVAHKLAFFRNSRVHPGDVLEVPAGMKASWFKPVAEAAAPVAPKAEDEPNTLSGISRRKAKAPIEVPEDVI